MDEKFWADLDATRLAMERATASIDVSKLASAASTVQQFASTIDFDKISLSLAVRDHVFSEYERLRPTPRSWARRSRASSREVVARCRNSIPRSSLRCGSRYPRSRNSTSLLAYWSERVGFVMQSTACNAVHSVEQRLARWQLETALLDAVTSKSRTA